MSVIRLGRLTKTLKQCSSVSFNYEINKSYSPKKDNRWYRTRYVSCNGKRFWFISYCLLILYMYFFDFVIQCKKCNINKMFFIYSYTNEIMRIKIYICFNIITINLISCCNIHIGIVLNNKCSPTVTFSQRNWWSLKS